MRAGVKKRNLLSIYLPSTTTTTDLDSPFVHNLIQYHLLVDVMIRQRSEGKSKVSGISRSVCQIIHFMKFMPTFRNCYVPLCKPFFN